MRGAAARLPRVVATARSYCAVSGPHQDLLRDAGFELVLAAPEVPLDAPALAHLARDADALLLGLDHCDASVFEAAPRLRVVARYGVGVDNVDLDAAAAHGVVVTNTPGANTIAVAELTLSLLLALARGLPAAIEHVRGGGWSRSVGWELSGRTLGLVGIGRIGREVAARAQAFGMRVVAADPLAPDVPGVERVALDELWGASDAVSLHVGLSSATRHLVDARALERMRPHAVLVNTARGGLVDEGALASALRRGVIAGAAADCFEHEPPGDSPLLALPTFIATPHLGAGTAEAAHRMGMAAARNVVAVLTGDGEADVVAGPRAGAESARSHDPRRER
ncbi:MAG: phosphoglycerate dehydrogenase [Trueperaceae bacterium]|nr:phosphoglycerate dehydrogenase [Trueperaceae bacterium]